MKTEEILFAAVLIVMAVVLCTPYFWRSFILRMNVHFEDAPFDGIYLFTITHYDSNRWYGFINEKGERRKGFIDKNQEMPHDEKLDNEDLQIGDNVTVCFYRYLAESEECRFLRV